MGELKRSAWMIGAAALLPLLLFAIFQYGYAAREQRRTVEARAQARSETVILRADAIVERLTTGMDAAATAVTLRNGDWPGFVTRAAELGRLSHGWVSVQVFDPAGRELARSGPKPTRLVRSEPINDRTQPRHVGFAWGEGCPCVTFERSAQSRGGPVMLQFQIPSALFLELLPATTSDYPVSAIAGPHGRFIARSVSNDGKVGTIGSTYLINASKSGRKGGLYRGRTLEGFESYTAFHRSPLTGWSAHVALGANFIDDPRRQFLGSLGLAALLSGLLAAFLITFAIRQMVAARRMGERMQQSQKLEALGQLTGGIAHDFNNLLTPIVGALDFLAKRQGTDDRSRRVAEGALASANRAGKLTSQLLAFSRRQKMTIAAVDLTEMLAAMRPLLQQTVGNDHEVIVETDGDVDCVKTDHNQLELALINLVVNARDASPPGRPIRLAARRTGDKVEISVTDEGVGMDAETRRRAFEPFFTTKAPGKGTGLGLAQVFGLAQQSGGSVAIDSTAGEGTTISLALPACALPDRAVTVPLTGTAAAAIDPAPLRLLVVDDDAAVRAMIARRLEEDGHSVDSVADARVGLSAVEHCDYDLVLVDFAMPVVDGAALIRDARALKPDLKFLMITGYADSDAVVAACPNTPILRKPFDPDEMAALVRDAAGKNGG